MWARRLVLPMLLLLAAACSMKAMIETMTSPEDRSFAMRFVEKVRSGDPEALRPRFDPGLWAKSRDQLAQARPLFPPGEGSTRLVAFEVAANVENGESSTRKDFVLVTTDQTHWTRTRIATLAEGGPARVVEWNVEGFDKPPPELQLYESMERLASGFRVGALIALAGVIALVWWLVRRSRRRAAGGP